MTNLTREEKRVLVFLLACFLVGSGVSYFRKEGIVMPAQAESESGKTAHATKEPVNINTAEFTELIRLKGIGGKTALNIIDHREANGPFFCKEDLKNVRGIGPAKLRAIESQITVR